MKLLFKLCRCSELAVLALKICEIFVVIEALRAECGVNEETCVIIISQNANDIMLNRSHRVDTWTPLV